MSKSRQIIKTGNAEFGPYFDYPEIQDMQVLKLSYQDDSAQGAYMIKMQPGAVTEVHTHRRREEYFIIQGDLIESDGTVLQAGDYVIYPEGSRHNSRTESGCVLIAVEYDFNDRQVK